MSTWKELFDNAFERRCKKRTDKLISEFIEDWDRFEANFTDFDDDTREFIHVYVKGFKEKWGKRLNNET